MQRAIIGKSKIRVASEQSRIRLNYLAHTSVSLKPGWILTSLMTRYPSLTGN